MIALSTARTSRSYRFARSAVRRGGVLALVLAVAPAMAQDVCQQPTNGRWPAWLDAQEDAGGHTKSCHLNVTINGLIGRIENRGGHKGPACLPGAAASAWSQERVLLDAIEPAIIEDGRGFARGAAGDHIISGSAGAKIGTIVTAYTGSNPRKNRSPCPGNSKYVCSDAKNWLAIVRKTAGGDCYLLTAYPAP